MDPVIGPAEYEPSIPRDVDQLVRKLIAKDPGERLPDGAAVVNAIAERRIDPHTASEQLIGSAGAG